MGAIDLLQPLLDGGVQRNNFFNGRLLSAEDLRAEQDATRRQLREHGRAFGDGVAWGLGVELLSATAADPRVRIAPGLGFDRLGNAVALPAAAELRLVPEATPSEVAAGLFAACDPSRPQATLAGAGLWVLTASPASGWRGEAPVSDPNATAVGRGVCGARFAVEGVVFRLAAVALDAPNGLVPLGVDTAVEAALRALLKALLDATGAEAREKLRNVLAHACYGSGTLAAAFAEPGRRWTDTARDPPGGAVWARWGLLDAMRERGDLGDCDLPLALLVLDANGIRLLDVWSVRRRPLDARAVDDWRFAAGGRRAAEGEAAFLQFQAQLEGLRSAAPPPLAALKATDWLDPRPAAGGLPAAFDWRAFLGAHAPAAATPVDAALLRGIVEASWHDEPFALATSPPVPLRVYQVPGDGSVVFARSRAAQLRLLFTPAPAAGSGFAARVEPLHGAAVASRLWDGGPMRIGELPAGRARLRLESPAHEPVEADVELVAGRTTDLAVTLVPLKQGAIRVAAVDKASGASIGTALDEVVATGPSPATTTQRGALQGDGRWLVAGLAAGRYALRATAPGFRPATAAAVTVPAVGSVDVTLDFERTPVAPPQPARCIGIAAPQELRTAKIKRLRLCVVPAGAVFEREAFAKTKPTESGRARAPQTKFAVARRSKPRPGFEIGPAGELLFAATAVPWAQMQRLPTLPKEVADWLADWRDWLSKVFDDPAIARTTPAVYLALPFRPPTSERSVPKTPPAWAVFGPVGLPMTIGPDELSTKGPVGVRDGGLKGVPEPIYRALEDHDIRTVNDVVWIWEEIVVDITGEPDHVAALTIDEARQRVQPINDGLGYYAGMDAASAKALKDAGLTDDDAIAKAGVQQLAKVLGSEAFAHRVLAQAAQAKAARKA